MIETTALLARPESASLGVTSPSHGSVTITSSATTSTRTHSVTKSSTVAASTIRKRIICGVMDRPLAAARAALFYGFYGV